MSDKSPLPADDKYFRFECLRLAVEFFRDGPASEAVLISMAEKMYRFATGGRDE